MESNTKRPRGRPKKEEIKKKKRYTSRKNHNDENRKNYFKTYYLGQRYQKKKYIDDNDNNDNGVVSSKQYTIKLRQIEHLQNENIALQHENDNNNDVINSINVNTIDTSGDEKSNHHDNAIGKNFNTLILCFKLRVIDNLPINNISQAIYRFYEHVKLSYEVDVWSQPTIKLYFRYRLFKLNMFHLSFIMITNNTYNKALTLGFDGTTKNQHSYQHLRLTGSNEIEPESLTIGYIRLYATDSNADVFGIKSCVKRLNDYMKIWQNNTIILHNSNYNINDLQFKDINQRVKNFRFDRSIVNFSAASKLNNDKILPFNVSNENIYNCIRHDKNSLFSSYILYTYLL